MQFLASAPCFQMKGSSYKAVMGRAQLNASATCFPVKRSSTHLRDDPEAGVEDFPRLFCTIFHQRRVIRDGWYGAQTTPAATISLFF